MKGVLQQEGGATLRRGDSDPLTNCEYFHPYPPNIRLQDDIFSRQCFKKISRTLRAKIKNSETSEISNFLHQNNLQVLKNFLSFRFLYKGQNRKLGNLGNFQLPPAKQLQVLKKFLSFPHFRFLHKDQNRKLGNLRNFQFTNSFFMRLHSLKSPGLNLPNVQNELDHVIKTYLSQMLYLRVVILQRSIHCLQRTNVEHLMLLM